MIEFQIPLEQIPSGTAQQKRLNRKTGHFFANENVTRARNLYIILCRRFAPKEPLTGCVDLQVIFAYNTSAKRKKGTYKPTRPDVDNIVKLYIDCLAECGFFGDDAQIVRLTVTKMYSERDHAYISTRIKQIGEDESEQE